jgi:hypothetical protein
MSVMSNRRSIYPRFLAIRFGRLALKRIVISLGLSFAIIHTTAALTPNAGDNIGAANIRTNTTIRPTMQARRPNSVSSPPQSIVPPAIAMPISPIA